jgi:hypothetical protein
MTATATPTLPIFNVSATSFELRGFDESGREGGKEGGKEEEE